MKQRLETIVGALVFAIVFSSGIAAQFIIWDYARFGWDSVLWSLGKGSPFTWWACLHAPLVLAFWVVLVWDAFLSHAARKQQAGEAASA